MQAATRRRFSSKRMIGMHARRVAIQVLIPIIRFE
jgi:hypothetical protein